MGNEMQKLVSSDDRSLFRLCQAYEELGNQFIYTRTLYKKRSFWCYIVRVQIKAI